MSCTYIRMRYCSVLGVLVISTKRRTYKFTYLVWAGVQGTPGTEYTCYMYPKRPTERRSTVYQTDRPTDRLNFPFGLHPYRRVLKTPELTANCHFCEDTREGVRYYTPRVRRARLLKKVGEAYAIKYGIGTPERGPPCEDTPYWRAGAAGAGHLH